MTDHHQGSTETMSVPRTRPKAPKGADQAAGPAERSFSDTFRHRPARAPHGLAPGRRVWATLGWAAAVSATVTFSAALASSGVLDREEETPTSPTSDRIALGGGTVPSEPTATPSASPSPSPSEKEKKKRDEKEKSAGDPDGAAEEQAVVRPAAPVTVTAEADPDEDEKKSSGSSKSGSSSGGSEKSGTTAKKQTQDFSRPVGRISGLYDPFIGRCVQLVGSGLRSYTCDGGADQNWQFASDGTLRKDGRCLSLAGRDTGDGTPVVMASCDSTNVTQWRYSSGNDIVNVAADKCLDVAAAATSDGTPLQIAYCSGNSAQKWAVP
ncbi:RICIN domain-containing protein [Streptomyces sp. CRN 30]|uniref:RICIN domain-containing protein n=1 Tax=Streptomyces sp. CRN 30 TaxID=3075613 RepID=UPI002A8254E9|nr:RICIN domain-containing protein [Streptomyces sp. CRN 30]